MSKDQHIIDQLKAMLGWKRSKQYYAEKLGTTEETIEELLTKIRNGETIDHQQITDTILKFENDIQNKTAEATIKVKDEIRDLQDLIDRKIINTEEWNILHYVQNYWGNTSDPHWQVKVKLAPKTDQQNFNKQFEDFLKIYIPRFQLGPERPFTPPVNFPSAMLVINKQDEHLNKYDINGDNSLDKRFNNVYTKTKIILEQACLSNRLDEITYIIGSDEFNSEWTGLTTKGTPQTNNENYQIAFKKICDYELNMINLLRTYTNRVNVVYIPGNHDEYVGWHLITWLKAFYRNEKEVDFDTETRYRKYIKYGNSAIMLNHGDAIKPAKLASMFPIEYREGWSGCSNYYIFTGDKHHEMSADFFGIKFYQIPALSKAKSLWDDKHGHTCSKAELTAFVIDRTAGITSILKQPL